MLQGLDFFRLLKPDAWLHVLKNVRENLEFKTAYFMLVNTIIAQSDDIKSRNKVREVYMCGEQLTPTMRTCVLSSHLRHCS